MKGLWIGVLATLVVISGLGGWMYSHNMLDVGTPSNRQPSGDPPVTGSDGSLDFKSSSGWKDTAANATTQQLTPIPLKNDDPAKGTLMAGCNMTDDNGKPVAAYLWTDDDHHHVIPPGATIVIHHDSGDTSASDKVTIQLPNPTGPITITTDDGSFLPEDLDSNHKPYKHGKHNRRHSRPGDVNLSGCIAIQDSGGGNVYTWPPSGYQSVNPHFTLAFCYQ